MDIRFKKLFQRMHLGEKIDAVVAYSKRTVTLVFGPEDMTVYYKHQLYLDLWLAELEIIWWSDNNE